MPTMRTHHLLLPLLLAACGTPGTTLQTADTDFAVLEVKLRG